MPERLLKTWAPLAAALYVLNLADGPYPGSHWLSNHFFLSQDLPVLAVLFALGAAALVFPGPMGRAVRALGGATGAVFAGALPPRRAAAAIIALSGLCGLIAWLGGRLVYDGYALSMDEFMANFDAVILARGETMARFAPAWRPFLGALGPQFLFHPGAGAYWMSQYLPVNAALRALGRWCGAESLVSPLLAAVSVLAVFGVGRRLWPDEPRVAWLAAMMLATSSQLLVTAMTPYAMTAHLAFNLVWLWLFLGGGWRGHLGALTVGVLACGLHQLAFHPLFVAPFILQSWLDRRWALGVVYTLVYAGACLFWLDYAVLAAGLVGAKGLGTAGGASWFATHAGVNLKGVGLMAKNLIRFATWQNLLTAPLFALGAIAAIRAKGAPRALMLGFIFTNLAAYGIMAYQGHGWGYRYVHGLLGSVCLIAAWTWSNLTKTLTVSDRTAGDGAMAAFAALSLLVLFPLRAWQTHAFVHPYALADAQIRAARTDGVIVDIAGSRFTMDLVRNDPYLANRPLVFYRPFVDEAGVRTLCAHHTLSVFDRSDAGRLGIATFETAPAGRLADLKPLLRSLKCDMTAPKEAREPVNGPPGA